MIQNCLVYVNSVTNSPMLLSSMRYEFFKSYQIPRSHHQNLSSSCIRLSPPLTIERDKHDGLKNCPCSCMRCLECKLTLLKKAPPCILQLLDAREGEMESNKHILSTNHVHCGLDDAFNFVWGIMSYYGKVTSNECVRCGIMKLNTGLFWELTLNQIRGI